MLFSEIPGQESTKQQLVNMVQHNRLSHALLFLSREGSGALSIAQALAQYIVCEKTNPTASPGKSLFGEELPVAETVSPDDACGVCAGCRKASQLIHPDIHFSYPVIKPKPNDKPKSTDFIVQWRQFLAEQPYGNSYDWLQFIDAENKQGNIPSEECEDILRKMHLKSFESQYKILIIWLPEMLGKEGNKLLKLIEEPPPYTLFILVSENEAAILPTIISRTQLVKIPPLSTEAIKLALIDKGLPEKQASMLATMSEGNMRETMHQFQHDADDWSLLLKHWLNSIVQTGPAEQLKSIDAISKIGREKQKQLLRYFTHIMQLSLRLYTHNSTGDAPVELSAFAAKMKKMCSPEQLGAMVHELDTYTYYIERNANAKMLFHALTIRLYHIISNKSVILVN